MTRNRDCFLFASRSGASAHALLRNQIFDQCRKLVVPYHSRQASEGECDPESRNTKLDSRPLRQAHQCLRHWCGQTCFRGNDGPWLLRKLSRL